MRASRSTRVALLVYGIVVIFLLYLPLISVGFASISKARYLSFPIRTYATKWYGEALASILKLHLNNKFHSVRKWLISQENGTRKG